MKHRLTIQAEDTILDFQKKFNRIYPFLKIEFFEKAHIAKQGSHKREMITSNRLFHGLIGRGKTHIINFNDNFRDRKSSLNSSHIAVSRMPSSA